MTKQFKVALLSTNTNSFGLQHCVLVAKDGDAIEAYPSKYGSNPPKKGDIINVRVDANGYSVPSSTGWEMARHTADAEQGVVDIIWNN